MLFCIIVIFFKKNENDHLASLIKKKKLHKMIFPKLFRNTAHKMHFGFSSRSPLPLPMKKIQNFQNTNSQKIQEKKSGYCNSLHLSVLSKT